jgi:hypothetical protein
MAYNLQDKLAKLNNRHYYSYCTTLHEVVNKYDPLYSTTIPCVLLIRLNTYATYRLPQTLSKTGS